MLPTYSEIVGCVAYHLALYFLCAIPRIQGFLSRHLRIPDARCPHCDEEVMNAFEKCNYRGKASATYFKCPFCEGWARSSAIALLLIAVPVAIVVLIILVQVRELWLRILVYFIAISAMKYLDARMDNLAESMGPLL